MAKQPVKQSKILINVIGAFAQWIACGYPFDKAKACYLCVTQHARLAPCAAGSAHDALRKEAFKLTKSWDHLYPQTEEQAQQILKLRRKFYRFFAPAPRG
jgi:hypothetical protein